MATNTARLKACGGLPPYAWAVTQGGATLSNVTGTATTVTCTPASQNTSAVKVTCTDAAGVIVTYTFSGHCGCSSGCTPGAVGNSPTVGWCLSHARGIDNEAVCVPSGTTNGGGAGCDVICCPSPYGTTAGDTPPCGYPAVAMTYNGSISGTPKTGLLLRTRGSTDEDCVGVGFYIDESDSTIYFYSFDHEDISSGGTLLGSCASAGTGFYFLDAWMFTSEQWDPGGGYVALSYDATGPYTSSTLKELTPAWLFATSAEAATEMGSGGLKACVWGRQAGTDAQASWSGMSGLCGNCYECLPSCDTTDGTCTDTLAACGE